MGSLETFESTLKEVVNGKRLSASKMTKLTEIAMKNMESDTQLVSIMYRTHKTLPPSAKVSSLYAFDALCRAARHQVTKQSLTGDINSEQGNAATFLLKVEGVLDGLVADMISSGTSESKEKTKKILDIWTKSNTFPTAVLTRLTEVVAKTEKETNKPSTSTHDPRIQHQPPPSAQASGSTTPPGNPPIADPQAALLALLTSAAAAASSSNGQTNANKPPMASILQPQLDPLQLALLQQLANKANVGIVPHAQPVQLPVTAVPQQQQASLHGAAMRSYPPLGRVSSPPDIRDYPDSDRRDPRFNRYEEDSYRGSGRDVYDDRRDFRGGPPRGGHRSRGRDDRGRYGERDRVIRDRDDDWGPPSRRRRSRSRSPPSRSRFTGGRRDVKPYSPPHRPSIAAAKDRDEKMELNRPIPPSVPEVGKDEFGRDIRPESPKVNAEPASNYSTALPADQSQSMQAPDPNPAPHESSAQPRSPTRVGEAVSASTSTSEPRVGLDRFDFSNFNFTDPASWKALGEAFMVTNGYAPSQEELMQLVSSGMMMAPQWGSQGWGGYGGQTDYNNSGDSAYSGMWNGQGNYDMGSSMGNWAYPNADVAAVEGKLDAEAQETNAETDYETVLGSNDATQSSSVGASGQMKKVGDKWVFVRDGAMV